MVVEGRVSGFGFRVYIYIYHVYIYTHIDIHTYVYIYIYVYTYTVALTYFFITIHLWIELGAVSGVSSAWKNGPRSLVLGDSGFGRDFLT